MTLHVSKGLEFPVVGLAGAGRMPAESEDEREEARLFYVGAAQLFFFILPPDLLSVFGLAFLLYPAILQPRHPVEHRLATHPVVHAVGHEVAVTFELELVVRLRAGQ